MKVMENWKVEAPAGEQCLVRSQKSSSVCAYLRCSATEHVLSPKLLSLVAVLTTGWICGC